MINEELYTKGTRVWLPDKELVWIGGTLTRDLKDKQLEVELEDGREIVLDLNITKNLPPLRNPEILVGSDDLTTLSYLHEPAVLYNLTERFVNSQNIYTYCGIVLVALNPYQDVPLYSSEIIHAYSGRQMHDIDPHIFGVAEDAFRSMVTLNQNQSIIVSGESGAGKTVSAKYTMRYFANVGGSTNETMVEQRVLASNPIMEAIGNAKTIRNDNSSRFGKYIEINFDDVNNIIGAHMRTYLLEKSRVVYQAADERNYHIFYQLCASSHLPEMEELNLGHADTFLYTQQGDNPVIDGVDDAKEFQDTCGALSLLGIYNEQQRMMWRILAAVLHLGNINIVKAHKSGDQCVVKEDDFHARMVSTLLGIDNSQLRKWLCARKIIATGDVYVKPLTLKEAQNGRNALAKHIYSMLFKWVVRHINNSLAINAARKSFIGVLDIYGFETFKVNSFEQFCINYANEKLQQQFNQHVFKLEQEEYIREQINWSFIDFYDNQPCIDLIEIKLGILDLLDEECRMPKGSDEEWALKLYKQHVSKSKYFLKPRLSESAFIVRHYADDVIYDCNGFVEKNRDLINDEHLNLLCASEYELVGDLFSNNAAVMSSPRKRTLSRTGSTAPKTKKTVGSEFRDSLKLLMETLNSTCPHYVRCIKSNDTKSPFQLNPQRCVQQLRACGVLETIRISAAGYPSRWTYKEFFDRYRMLISWKRINWNSLHDTCNIILSELIKDEDKFQLGKTKIFFRAGSVAYLERQRNELLRKSCVMIQKNVRCWMAARKFKTMKKSAIAIQCFVRCYQARKLVQFLRETRASTKIQKIWRGHKERSNYLHVREQIIAIQAQIRGVLQRRRLRAHIENLRSIVIQKYWRMHKAQGDYKRVRKGIILIQCYARRMAAKKILKQLKIEARSVEHLKTLTKGMEMKVITLQQKINEQSKEKQVLSEKVEQMKTMEDEIQKFQHIRPQLEQLKKSTETLESDKKGLLEEKEAIEEKNKNLQEKLDDVSEEKDGEIEKLKAALERLQKSLDEEQTKNKNLVKEHEESSKKALNEQKENLLAEFTVERTSHQKMISDNSRLEQRFNNLQEEYNSLKSSPDKRRSTIISFPDSQEESVNRTSGSEDDIENLTSDLYETARERDMLLEQVELLQQEQDISVKTQKVDLERSMSVELTKQNEDLKAENTRLLQELDIIQMAVENDENDENDEAKTAEKKEHAMTKLIAEIKELRTENKKLQKKSDRPANIPIISTDNNNVPDLAQKEITRLTVENLSMKEEINALKVKLKESVQSPSQLDPDLPAGLPTRTKSNVTELSRRHSKAIESRLQDGSMSEAGKLFMTYAGLTRKKTVDSQQSLNGIIPEKKSLGILKFTLANQDAIVKKLVTDMKPEYVEKEVPGLPAHIIFMGIRYIDNINQERLMQSFLTSVISAVKKRATENLGDIDNQAFWLANTFRLYSDMKQYSGDQQFQSMSSRDQNEHCLNNFDLSEYRQVLSDTCVKIYQDMVTNIQSRIVNLIVPGMLEYESIPGVVSTLRRFKNEKQAEEIITVKDITNKLSAILAVLNAHCVEPSLIKQIFVQIYYFVNATMINNILLRKDMCHWSRGLQIKFNLTQLEEWCRTNQLHEKYGVVEQLEPITEVVQLLQVNKKSLDDVEAIIAIVYKLNAAQVQKILSMYTPPNDYEPRVPGNLIRTVVSKLPKGDTMYLMMDLKYITPMTVGFAPSNVNLDKITIPSIIGLDTIAEVL